MEQHLLEKVRDGLVELRPKNHGVARICGFAKLADAVAESATLQVLYLQSQPLLDDLALRLLAVALTKNKRIIGINLGELDNVSSAGWAAFIDTVPQTGLLHCYAQTTMGGPGAAECARLKAAIVRNRQRLEASPSNCKGMWRNSDYPLM